MSKLASIEFPGGGFILEDDATGLNMIHARVPDKGINDVHLLVM
jgi:hypothetical protein